MGPVGLLLNMTGHERETAKGVAISAVLNMVLNFLLIPRWGITGAAVATTVSMIAWNLLLAWQVNTKLTIQPTIFGKTGMRVAP